MAGNNYKLLLQAEIDAKAALAKVKSDALKETIKLNVKIDLGDTGKAISGIDTIKQRFDEIKSTTDKLASMSAKKNAFGIVDQYTLNYMDELKNKYTEVYKLISKPVTKTVLDPITFKEIQITEMVSEWQKVEKVVDGVAARQKELERSQREENKALQETTRLKAKELDEMERAAKEADLFLAKSKNLASTPSVQNAIGKATDLKNAVSEGDIAKVRKFKDELDLAKASLQTGRTGLDSWSEGMRNAIKQTIEYATSIGLVYGALNQIKQGIQYIKDLNKELTNIQVLQIEGASSDKEIADLSMQYNDLAKSLGTTTIEVTKGSVEWLRQGKSIKETQELLKSTMYLSKLGALDSAQATEYLTAILNGFNMEASNSERVVDKLVAIDNIAATSAGELATAMQYSSSVASQAGVSFDSLAAMIGAVSSNTRLSAEMIGTAFKTMFVRMQEVKAGAIDETGMSLNKVEKTLSSVGIALRDSKDSFRPLEEVIADVAEKWNTLSEVQQAQISNAIAGQRQAQIFTSLMQNWGDVTKYVTAETESLSLAEKNYGIYLENIESKQNEVRASWEKLVSGAATKEFIISFYDGANAVLEFLDSIGGIPTVLKIAIPLIIAFNAELIKTKILATGNMLQGLLSGLQSLVPAFGATTVAAEGTAASISAANVAALPFVATIGLITAGLIYGIKAIHDYKIAQDEILNTLKDNSSNIKETSSSYDEYVKKTKEAAEAQGYFVENGKVYHEGYRGAKVYVEGMDLLTESMWRAINSVDEGDRKLETFNRDLLDTGGYAEEASVSYQSLAEKIKEITQASSELSDIMSKAETGQFDFSSIDELAAAYPDYLQALSVENGQLKLNTDMVREYLVQKADQAVADAEAAGATENEIAVLQAYANQLRETQYVLLDGVQVTTGAFNEMAFSVAQDAAMSGNSFVDMQGKALNSADAIYKYMTSGNQSFNDLVRQIANVTGMTVQDVMNQINGMIQTTTNNAAALINYLGASSLGVDSGFNRAPTPPKVQNSLFSGTSLPRTGSYGGSGGGGKSNSNNNSQLERQRDLENQIKEIESQIEEARKNAVDDLKDQLDTYKDIIDARKEILDTLADERQYQQDVDNKNKEILKVQNELATLQFDTSEEANARRLELEDQLANLNQDLENIQYDQSIEVQKNALDDEYKSLENTIGVAIKQIEGIQASSLSDFTSQLSSVLNNLSVNIPQYHDGGVVGQGMSLKGNELFAKLLKGEIVSTPSQIENFMSKTLPNMIQQGSSNFTGGNVELNMPVNINGNLDKSAMQDLDKFAEKLLVRLQQMMNQKGFNRRADLFQT